MSGRRKQTTQQANRRKQHTAVRHHASQAKVMSPPTRSRIRQPPGWERALAVCIALAFCLVVDVLLLYGQVQVGRVLVSGIPARGTVVALEPCVSPGGGGDETIVFTDARNKMHRVRHMNFTPGLCATYQVGEVLAIRYVPSDPSDLMPQPEIDNLWFNLIFCAVCDILFVFGAGLIVFMTLQPTVSRLVAALRAQWRV